MILRDAIIEMQGRSNCRLPMWLNFKNRPDGINYILSDFDIISTKWEVV